MKKSCFLIFFLSCYFVFAQTNDKLCIKNQLNVQNLISEKNYIEATKIVDQTLKICPKPKEQFLLNAEKLYNINLLAERNQATKIEIVKSLINVFDVYDKKFPLNENGNGIKKATLLFDNNLGTKQEIYYLLDKNFNSKKPDFTNPKLFYIYFDYYLNEAKNSKTINSDKIISKYIAVNSKNIEIQKEFKNQLELLSAKQKTETLSDLENNALKQNNDNLLAYQTIQNATKKLLQPYLTCSSVNNYATALYEENKNNDAWLKFVSEELFTKFCLSSEMFLKVAQQSNLINSTSKSSFYLGYLLNFKNKTTESEQYFNQSADLETNIVEKANVYYTLATTIFGISNKQKSVEYLQKSIALNPNSGKAYLFLAQLYESSIDECTKTDFEKKAINWLIAKTIEKAGIAEPYLKDSVTKQAEAYLAKVPNKTEILKSRLAGKTLTFDCFMNETIAIPNN